MRSVGLVTTLLAAGLGSVIAVEAQDDPRRRTDIAKELAQQLYRESQERHQCKIRICDVARSKKMQGENVACTILKTWPAIDLKERILKNRFTWRWGDAQCEAELAVDRALILAAALLPKFVAKVGKHDIECRIAVADGKQSHTVKFTVDPIVTFENAKAVKAALRWGNVTGSAVVKITLWSATAVDNAFNVMEGVVLEQVNDFFLKCEAAPPTQHSRRGW